MKKIVISLLLLITITLSSCNAFIYFLEVDLDISLKDEYVNEVSTMVVLDTHDKIREFGEKYQTGNKFEGILGWHDDKYMETFIIVAIFLNEGSEDIIEKIFITKENSILTVNVRIKNQYSTEKTNYLYFYEMATKEYLKSGRIDFKIDKHGTYDNVK
jgi:hypothetical protein